ncbi:MAG: translocation/assembly module TamB [Candidatus Cloacimonetes bacterium]|nr:translocation/assembly module TamB [Candidatus Cloacimonadota bacterium]
MRKILKFTGAVLLLILALLLITVILIQTRPVKNLIADRIVANVNSRLVNATLNIERLEIKYLSSVTLKGVSISRDKEIILSLKELGIHYSLRDIRSNKIVISAILLDELNLDLQQNNEGEWNLMTMLPAADKKAKPKKKTQSSDWEIELADFNLRNSEITINSAQISEIMLHFTGKYSGDESLINLDKFSFICKDPDLKLEKLDFKARLKNNKVMLSNMHIKTAENTVNIGALIDLDIIENTFIDLNSESLNLSEFAGLIAQKDIGRLPELDLGFTLENQKASLSIEMEEAGQKFDISAVIEDVFKDPEYTLKLTISHFNGGHWLDNPEYNSDLNLDLTVIGRGFELEEADTEIQLNVRPGFWGDIKFSSVVLDAQKNGSTADFNTSITGEFGRIGLSGRAEEIFNEVSYNLQGDLAGVDLAILLQDETLKSDLNLGFELQGKGFEPEELTADLKITGRPSEIIDIELDMVKADIHYEEENYIIRNLELMTSAILLKLKADGNIKGGHNLDFQLSLIDLQPMSELVNAETLKGSGDIRGNIILNDKTYKANVNLKLEQLQFNEYSLGEMSGEILIDSELEAPYDVSLTMKEFASGEFVIDNIDLQINGDEKRQKIVLDAGEDKLLVHLESGVLVDSMITIELPVFRAEYEDLQVETRHTGARILIGDKFYQIDGLQLAFNEGSLMLDGTIAPADTQQVILQIKDVNLEPLNNLGLISSQIAGIFNLKAEIGGYLSEPEISAEMQLTDIGWDDFQPGNLQFTADIKSNKAEIFFSLEKDKKELISGSARIPLYLNPRQSIEIIPYNEPLEADLLVSDYDISFLAGSIDQIKKMNGILGVDLHLRNNLSDPLLSGEVKLEQASISVPQYGINYPKIRLKAAFQQRNINLEELYVAGGDGYLRFSGNAEVKSPISEGIKSIELRLKADNFSLADKRGLQVKLNSDIKLAGSPDKLVYSGYLNIPKAIIDLDALPGSSVSKVDINSPLLVKAEQKYTAVTVIPVKQKKASHPDLIKNLTGEMKVTIPRNTWIRNKDMNVEISGDLRIIKKGKNFELYGTVKTLRGKYELYGKKFDLKGGTITFNGGSEFNALLDLNISHVFRDIYRNKRTLRLQITGDLKTPGISFYLDDEEITESDAISYLLFGRSSSEISQGEKSEVARQTESDLALSMLSKTIGNKLASEIGKKLNLDVIEFSGGESWKQAAIVVGKYITNDLFISYKKEFSLDQSSEIVPDEVSLEYEMNKYISVQATRGDEKSTGVDLYWKFKLK